MIFVQNHFATEEDCDCDSSFLRRTVLLIVKNAEGYNASGQQDYVISTSYHSVAVVLAQICKLPSPTGAALAGLF